MQKGQRLQQHIADEVRRIRYALRTIAASLHPGSNAHQRAAAEQKIAALEARIVALEALKHRESGS